MLYVLIVCFPTASLQVFFCPSSVELRNYVIPEFRIHVNSSKYPFFLLLLYSLIFPHFHSTFFSYVQNFSQLSIFLLLPYFWLIRVLFSSISYVFLHFTFFISISVLISWNFIILKDFNVKIGKRQPGDWFLISKVISARLYKQHRREILRNEKKLGMT